MKRIDYLKKKITQTGYPLEIEVSSLLDEFEDWTIVNTDTFFDRDGNKTRDIDISAFKWTPEKLLPLGLNVDLAIECKKSENFAWVFFTRPFRFDYDDIDGQYLDELQIRCKNAKPVQLREIVLEKSRLHYNKMKKVAVTFDEFLIRNKKSKYEKKKREIFEAINQLKKYITYTHEQTLEERFEGVYRFYVTLPCIVFDGEMYEAIITKGDVEIKKKKHLLLSTQYRPSYSVWEQGFLIDVVHRNYFQNYLAKIRRDISSLESTLTSNRDDLIKRLKATEFIGQIK